MVDLLCYKLHTENMKRITFLFACIITIYSSMQVYAWGPKGHDIVAAIAEQNLTKKTKKALDKILEGKSIVYYSSWMDNIQNSPNWKNGYDKTKTWHYANVDKGLTYETMEKNKKGDVLTGLEFLVNELTVNFDNLSDSLKQDYVKMVVHMVGDMHCPMHAGRSTDRGGNGKNVKWFGQKTNLHSVWDSKMIDSARKWSYTEWVNHLDRKDKKYKKAIVQGTYQDWFAETVARAEELYEYAERQGDEVPNFSYQYVYDFSPLLENRLQTGGYRLAHVLNTIFN